MWALRLRSGLLRLGGRADGVMGVEVVVRMEDVVGSAGLGWAGLGYGLVCWC